MPRIFQIDELRKTMQTQTIAGAGDRLRDRYQRGRVVRQFVTGSSPVAISRREKIPPKLAEQIVRERLAEHEFGNQAA